MINEEEASSGRFWRLAASLKCTGAATLGQTKDPGSSAVCLWQPSGILCRKSVPVQSDPGSEIVLGVESPGTSSVSSSGSTVTRVLPETGW